MTHNRAQRPRRSYRLQGYIPEFLNDLTYHMYNSTNTHVTAVENPLYRQNTMNNQTTAQKHSYMYPVDPTQMKMNGQPAAIASLSTSISNINTLCDET